MLSVIAVLVILLLSYLKFWTGRRNLYKLAEKIPGVTSYPLIGSAHLFLGNSQDIFASYLRLDEFSQRNGGYCKFWMGPNLYVEISITPFSYQSGVGSDIQNVFEWSADMALHYLTRDSVGQFMEVTFLTNPADVEIVVNTCFEKGNTYKFVTDWLGNGLIVGPVTIWRRHRKMLAPTFNQHVLDSFIDIFWEQSNTLIEKLRPKVGETEFDILDYISPCTLDIICETAMGVKVEAQCNPDNPYLMATLNEMKVINDRMSKIWLYPEFIFKLTPHYKLHKKCIETMHTFTNEVISKRRKEYALQRSKLSVDNGNYEPKTKTHKALLDLMMDLSEDGQRLTDTEIREEVDNITVAGSDTTALSVSFSLVMIGAYPDVQRKIVEELNEIFGDSKRSITMADLNKMQYLERVIKETLRKFPVLPMVARFADRDLKLTSVTIPSGTTCLVSIWGLSRNKDIWGEDADKFNPDRFLPERISQRHPCAFIPFSYGKRNCIGRQFAMMSMKVLVSTFLRNYTVKADPSLPVTLETILKPINGHNLSIEAR